jgi:hypothetical protein
MREGGNTQCASAQLRARVIRNGGKAKYPGVTWVGKDVSKSTTPDKGNVFSNSWDTWVVVRTRQC